MIVAQDEKREEGRRNICEYKLSESKAHKGGQIRSIIGNSLLSFLSFIIRNDFWANRLYLQCVFNVLNQSFYLYRKSLGKGHFKYPQIISQMIDSVGKILIFHFAIFVSNWDCCRLSRFVTSFTETRFNLILHLKMGCRLDLTL